jgi:hypothetical protein
MQTPTLFYSRITGRPVLRLARQPVDFIALTKGGSLTRLRRGVPGDWSLKSRTGETSIHVTVKPRAKNPTPTPAKKDWLLPREERAGMVHTARSKDRMGGNGKGGTEFPGAARSLMRGADKLKMKLRTNPSWFGADTPLIKDAVTGKMRSSTQEEATGRLRKTYLKSGFKDDTVTRSRMLREARDGGSFGDHYTDTKKFVSGVYHPLLREPRT